jgi:penicillin amidase
VARANWDDFQTARNRWGAPPLNLVYADTSGDIGWSAAGAHAGPAQLGRPDAGARRRPLRVEGLRRGRRPAGRQEPGRGFFATANAMNIPAEPDYPREARKLGFEWSDPTRSIRIHEVLAGQPKGTLADSMALQTDTVSPQARRGVALLKGLTSPDPEAQRALSCLQRWDAHERTAAPRPPSTRSGSTSTSDRRPSPR